MMFGLALSEAQRNQNVFEQHVRLQQQQMLRKQSQHRNPHQIQQQQPQQPNPNKSFHQPDDDDDNRIENTMGCDAAVRVSHKRTRRRRRPKKTKQGDLAGSMNYTSGASSSGGAIVNNLNSSSTKKQHDAPMTKGDLYFCLRCAVVGTGPRGDRNALGRVTLVNWDNHVVLDTFVQVPVPVTDYRTQYTGILPEHLTSKQARSLDEVRTKVYGLLKGKILIGHFLEFDLGALGLTHPWCDVRDSATFPPYMKTPSSGESKGMVPNDLACLVSNVLDRTCTRDSVEEAIACLDLYKLAREDWESYLSRLIQEKERQREIMVSMRASSNMGAPAHGLMQDEMSACASFRTLQHGETSYHSAHGRGSVSSMPCSVSVDEETSVDSSFQSRASPVAMVSHSLHRDHQNSPGSPLSHQSENASISPSFYSIGQSRCNNSSQLWKKHHSQMDVVGHSLEKMALWRTGSLVNPSSTQALDDNQDMTSSSLEMGPCGFTEEELRDRLPSNLWDDLQVDSNESQLSSNREESLPPWCRPTHKPRGPKTETLFELQSYSYDFPRELKCLPMPPPGFQRLLTAAPSATVTSSTFAMLQRPMSTAWSLNPDNAKCDDDYGNCFREVIQDQPPPLE